MLKSAMFAGLILAATPALAQPQEPQAPTPEIQAAGMAFGECVGAAIERAPTTGTPEAAASAALAGCATQRAALISTIESFIAGSDMPAERKQAALAQIRTQFAQIETQVATAIRQNRSGQAGE